MHRRFLIIFSAFGLGVLVYSLVLGRQHSAAPAQPEAVTAAPEPVDEEAQVRAFADEKKQTQANVEAMASLEVRRKLRDQAARQTYEARRQLQLSKAHAWSSVLSTNNQVFDLLRHQAESSTVETAHCTICDGTGTMDYCVLCENTSKCPSCMGTRKGLRDEMCATCLGTGKCYLCSGTGRMPCLYCDDGTISRSVPPPPLRLPIQCDPVPAGERELTAADATGSEPESADTIHPQSPGPEQQPPVAALVPSHTRDGLVLAVGLLLGGAVLAIRKAVALRNGPSAASDRWQTSLAEDPALPAVFSELRDRLGASAQCQLSETLESLNGVQPQASGAALQEFLAAAPGRVTSLRGLFSEMSCATDEAARQDILLEFHRQVSDLKDLAQSPEVRPFGLLAYALTGLLKQLASDASEVTPCTLRTIAGAVDLLETLCVPGLNRNLATEPPVRLLAVDDDAVSRLAISFALKKAFNEPDLAPDGEAALALAAENTYDVIFLDVDMPGMDGYELCTKIHKIAQHRTTPIVFVTRHGDFNSRAKSTLSGGEDLIGKPFLAFEITVKALTLALRARLQNEATAGETASANAAVASEAPEATASSVPTPAKEPDAQTAEQQGPDSQSTSSATAFHPNGGSLPPLIKGAERVPGEAFFTLAPARIEELHRRLEATRNAAEPAHLQEFLAELFLGVHSLSLEAERAELRTVFRLISALEGMLKKLLKDTNLCTPSALNAAAAALQLLGELFDRPDANPDLVRPPARILVVDDDPVALRAISGSIQLVFGRPDRAASGEAALALAAEKSFDLIFLDVLMPGIDGVETCKKIHETALNCRTPVVFVTGHDDAEARSEAALAGGCGFIAKPVVPSQIKLTALTFLLRARLNQSQPAPAPEEAACLA